MFGRIPERATAASSDAGPLAAGDDGEYRLEQLEGGLGRTDERRKLIAEATRRALGRSGRSAMPATRVEFDWDNANPERGTAWAAYGHDGTCVAAGRAAAWWSEPERGVLEVTIE